MDARVGTQVDDYRIESVLGVGGMGTVYGATAGDGTRVALKVVKDDLASDATFMRRFRREAKIARTVRNPHVVGVLDTGERYLVQELIDGSSLEHEIRRLGRLDLASTVSICRQVAAGLDALWEAGIVHRDVKPANILLSGGRVYITDFGLAKDTQGSLLTRTGQALGTLDYMAPEQIRGEPVDATTDVYSLGCVAFECLQGNPPFGDRAGLRVLWAHLSEPPPELVERPDVPDEVAAVVRRALSKDQAERPRSCGEFAALLSRAAG